MTPTVFTHMFSAMTTHCELQFHGIDAALGRLLAARIEARVATLVQTWNFHAPQSWLSRCVNQRRGAVVALDDEAAAIFQNVREHAERTHGAFDITVGTLAMRMRLVRSVKEAEAVRTQLAHCMGLQVWQFENGPQGACLRFAYAATRVDMGGVIKEYAVDEAARIAKEADVPAGIVNFGGDLVCWGNKAGGERFTAAIPDPRQPQRMLFALDLQDQALTTSGHYARRTPLKDGELSHVRGSSALNSPWQSASVLAKSAMVSGIYATALLRRADVALPADTVALVVDANGHVHTFDADAPEMAAGTSQVASESI